MCCMKYEMKQERNGIQSDMLRFREEGIACLALFTIHAGKINQKLTNVHFFPSIYELYNVCVVSLHRAVCQMELRTVNPPLRNKLFTIEVAVHLGLYCFS